MSTKILYQLDVKDRQQLVRRYLRHCSFLCTYIYMHFIFTYYTSNEREYISLSNGMNNLVIKLGVEK